MGFDRIKLSTQERDFKKPSPCLQDDLRNIWAAVCHPGEALSTKDQRTILLKSATIVSGTALMALEATPLAMVFAGIMMTEPVADTAMLLDRAGDLWRMAHEHQLRLPGFH